MLPLRTKRDTSASNDVTITAHELPCIYDVGMVVKQHIQLDGGGSCDNVFLRMVECTNCEWLWTKVSA